MDQQVGLRVGSIHLWTQVTHDGPAPGVDMQAVDGKTAKQVGKMPSERYYILISEAVTGGLRTNVGLLYWLATYLKF